MNTTQVGPKASPSGVAPARVVRQPQAGRGTKTTRPLTAELTRTPRQAIGIQSALPFASTDSSLEQEADLIANRVVGGRLPSEHQPIRIAPAPAVQRHASAAHGSPNVASNAGSFSSDAGAGHELPSPIREDFEARFGHDFSHVRLHTDAAGARMAASFNAKALTVGSHVVFGRGQFRPETSSGRHLLAHELTHVVQQRAGNPGLQRKANEPTPPSSGDVLMQIVDWSNSEAARWTLKHMPGGDEIRQLAAKQDAISRIRELVDNPDAALNDVFNFIQPKIDAIPAETQKRLNAASSPKADMEGIWRHLAVHLEQLRTGWKEILATTARDLIWPLDGVASDMSEFNEHLAHMWESITSAEFSNAIDHALLALQKINSALARLSGWMFLGAVAGGALLGAIGGAVVGAVLGGGVGALPGAAIGAITGAGGGLAAAASIGEMLLAPAVIVEMAVIQKALSNLDDNRLTIEQRENEYERIAGSLLTLGIMGAMIGLGKIGERIARGVLGAFRGEAPVPKGRIAGAEAGAKPELKVIQGGGKGSGNPTGTLKAVEGDVLGQIIPESVPPADQIPASTLEADSFSLASGADVPPTNTGRNSVAMASSNDPPGPRQVKLESPTKLGRPANIAKEGQSGEQQSSRLKSDETQSTRGEAPKVEPSTKPTRIDNPKHMLRADKPWASKQPPNIEDIFENAVGEDGGKHLWSKDASGNVHRFTLDPKNGTVHFSGSSDSSLGLNKSHIPNWIKKKLGIPLKGNRWD